MSCCGKQRTQFLASLPTGPASRPAQSALRRDGPIQPTVFFKYTGNTGMTVIGPISGRRYRFDGPGSAVEVDPRDRRSLATVPHLRQIP